ncbi:hypothetical protein NMY22_g7244 [Coprinellus aureogranulatus]|nr:hypothetical protein NMY22_g7244 [Coprinellus aureogranulatus]
MADGELPRHHSPSSTRPRPSPLPLSNLLVPNHGVPAMYAGSGADLDIRLRRNPRSCVPSPRPPPCRTRSLGILDADLADVKPPDLVESCEALIRGMKALVDRSIEHGVKHISMGMPHRGRLNYLANVIRKPIEAVPNECSGDQDARARLPETSSIISVSSTVTPPSPARMSSKRQWVSTTSLPTAPEDPSLIVNNQIGFTADPLFSCSTPYPSGIAKSIGALVFRINGDNVEAVDLPPTTMPSGRRMLSSSSSATVASSYPQGFNLTPTATSLVSSTLVAR